MQWKRNINFISLASTVHKYVDVQVTTHADNAAIRPAGEATKATWAWAKLNLLATVAEEIPAVY